MSLEPSPVKTPKLPDPGKRYFTVEQANLALPYVSRIVDDITRMYGRVIQLRKQAKENDAAGRISDVDKEYDQAMDRLGELVDELQHVGVELKDFERGLVDFPAVHDEREILLCWCRGEAKITHWHEVDTGFTGRQTVDLLD